MNHSGEAVRSAADFYKVPPAKVIVLFDDCAIGVGELRIRRKGSAGGHNGIKSLIEHLGTQDFPRVKIGVGEKPHPDYDMADWVLSNFSQSEFKSVYSRFDDVSKAVELIVSGETDKAMNLFN
jgi:PTH1 family peptidyl-tRNA hydrolase